MCHFNLIICLLVSQEIQDDIKALLRFYHEDFEFMKLKKPLCVFVNNKSEIQYTRTRLWINVPKTTLIKIQCHIIH